MVCPGFRGVSASGGTVQSHVYDEANRLVDEGVEYETLGNTTKLPATDAGEHEIKSTYYVDNQVATQEQNKTLDSYVYDPAGRAMETSSENTETKAKTTTVSHYAGSGGALTWTSEGTERWSRNIPGIDGTLCATMTSSTAPVLQLHDLQGHVVATAALGETETKLLSTYNSTEFGVPSEGKTPPKYAWLGASGLSTETSFGTGVSTQAGASYVPQVARDLQTAPPIPPGAFPNGQGTGELYGSEIPGWYISLSNQESAATLAAWTAKQEQLRREAEERAQLEGNGPGEETFGDPIHCKVEGKIIIDEEKAFLNGQGWCTQGLPAGTWLKICVGALPDLSTTLSVGECKIIEVKHHTSRYHAKAFGVGISCKEGELIRGYVAFWVPGGSKTMYAILDGVHGPQGECNDSSAESPEEFAISLWPQAELPTDLVSLFYLFGG